MLTSTNKCAKIKIVQERNLNTRERVKGEKNENFRRNKKNNNE